MLTQLSKNDLKLPNVRRSNRRRVSLIEKKPWGTLALPALWRTAIGLKERQEWPRVSNSRPNIEIIREKIEIE